MSDWQERITHKTAPLIRAEHELRYSMLAPLLAGSAVWGDLGCGTGVAALAALDAGRPPRAVLVDVDQELVDAAARTLAIEHTELIAGDLTNPADLERIAAALLSVDGERVVSCFEVVEHLDTFVPLLEWSTALARERAATFVLSVPNDAFWSIDNPYHLGAWGDGAFEELTQLLPAQRTLRRQVALAGSAMLDWSAAEERLEARAASGGADTVATHFIVSFGPRHDAVRSAGAAVVQADVLAQRRWERQRESDLAVTRALAAQLREERDALQGLQATVEEQRAELRAQTAQFEEWRTYIHELETELGRPLAGSEEAMRQAGTLPPQAPSASSATEEQRGAPSASSAAEEQREAPSASAAGEEEREAPSASAAGEKAREAADPLA